MWASIRDAPRPPPLPHAPLHIALCPCPNIRAIRRAHLIDVPCRASQPLTTTADHSLDPNYFKKENKRE